MKTQSIYWLLLGDDWFDQLSSKSYSINRPLHQQLEMQCMQKGEGGTLKIPLQENQGNKWEKKSTQATSVSMIILAINVVVSTLFIKIRDGGETLKYNIWWSIAETRFFSHTVHRILREFHRVALNILLHYPFWRLQYCIFFCDFYYGFFELEGVGVLKKRTMPMMLHMALMSSVFSKNKSEKKKMMIKILFLEPKLFLDPPKLFILFFNIFFRKHNISWTTK